MREIAFTCFIFACLAYFAVDQLAIHSPPACTPLRVAPVAQVAAQANAKRLCLVHINPLDESETPLDLESVKDIFAETTVAKDQMVIDV